jgi:hypothetical protein
VSVPPYWGLVDAAVVGGVVVFVGPVVVGGAEVDDVVVAVGEEQETASAADTVRRQRITNIALFVTYPS